MLEYGVNGGIDLKKITATLDKTRLFHNIDRDYLSKYASRMNERVLWKGEILVNEGDLTEGLYLVSEGTLAMQKYSIDGDYVSLQLLEVGDVMGHEFFYGTRNRYTYSVEAVTNANVIYIPRDVLHRFLTDSEQMKENFLRLISDNIDEQYTRIDILSQRNLRMKITRYLLHLHDKSQENTDFLYGDIQRRSTEATPVVELPVSKEITAKLLAMPRPSFSRELVRMEKEGLIRVNGRIIWLLDIHSLVYMGEDDEDEDE